MQFRWRGAFFAMLVGCASTDGTDDSEEAPEISVDEALAGADRPRAVAPELATPDACYDRLGERAGSATKEFEEACQATFAKLPSDVPCQLPLPRRRAGCQGEGCECAVGLRLARASRLRAEPRERANEVARLAAGTRLRSRNLFVVTDKVGRAAIRREFDIDGDVRSRLVVMDVLSTSGDGNYEFCQGRDARMGSESEAYWVPVAPRAHDWARVTTKGGATGWVPTADIESVPAGTACSD